MANSSGDVYWAKVNQ